VNTKCSLVILLLSMLSLIGYSAQAQPQPKTAKIQPSPVKHRLAKGDRAPFAGVLLTDAALAKIITDLKARAKLAEARAEKAEREAKAKLASAKKTCEIEIAGERKKTAIAEAGCARQTKILGDGLKACEQRKSSVFRSPYFNFIAGNVVAGGICALATFGARQ